jgi:hypothetical protein
MPLACVCPPVYVLQVQRVTAPSGLFPFDVNLMSATSSFASLAFMNHDALVVPARWKTFYVLVGAYVWWHTEKHRGHGAGFVCTMKLLARRPHHVDEQQFLSCLRAFRSPVRMRVPGLGCTTTLAA